MKLKFFNLLLIVTSQLGYLEWGGNNHTFLAEAEYSILKLLFTEPRSIVHPFVLFPLFGQLLLLITLFQTKPNKILTYIGIASLGLLLGLMFFIGIINLNIIILISTVPFWVVAVLTILYFKKHKAVI